MNTKANLLTILYLFASAFCFAQVDNEKHHVLIDTDCAPDDLRAINLILSSDQVKVLAITSEDGTLEPEDGYLKITALLNEFGHEGIPVSQGIITKNEVPRWRKLAISAKWGKELISYKKPREVKEFIINIIENEEQKVELICLGPLTNIANAILMKPQIKDRIKRIIWFDQCLSNSKWTNYGMDCMSADYLLNTEIPVYRIKSNKKPVPFTKDLYQSIKKIKSPYAQNIYSSHAPDSIQEKIKKGHLKIWDELAALYLLDPDIFEKSNEFDDSAGIVMQVKDQKLIKKKILHHLESFNKQNNVVFKTFPTDTLNYRIDINPLIDTIIDRYGLKEFKAITLTNEMHDHLGLYSIVGAKMGLRALEYFHTSSDHIEIQSHAGKKPPLSCFNDGLQVGSGCTLGNGAFHVNGGSNGAPRAIIKYEDRQIKIELKTKYYNQIQQTIIKSKNLYGVNSPEYWKAIRDEGITLWKTFDRKEIFNITEEK